MAINRLYSKQMKIGDMKDDKLSKKQIKELQNIVSEINTEAEKVVGDYLENPSEESGSFVHVHENSPYLATREERLISFDGKEIKIKPDKKA